LNHWAAGPVTTLAAFVAARLDLAHRFLCATAIRARASALLWYTLRMTRCSVIESTPILVAVVAVFATTSLGAQNLATSPPMGWSEWDAYGMTVTEADFKANAMVLAGLRQYGWQYALIDAGWYMENPSGASQESKRYVLDGDGRLMPVVNRFPSAAGEEGFKPLADWLHGQGLKFGIHVMPGIPRQAVTRNLPIAGSSFHALDAADTTQTCSWDSEFYVAKDNAAGQAYYDSIMRLYADWGVDYIKLGCVSDHPFRPTGIRQIAEAIKKTGRPMVLSLSPGPPPREYVNFIAKNAQVWRISEEHWDFWEPSAGVTGHMVGMREAFDLFAQWAPYVKPGNWVDGDLLPVGWLGPHPGWGEARQSRETADEQRTEFTLWAIARSPLILGANLTKLDDLTRSLITNREVIEINQKSWKSYPVDNLPPGFEHARVWEALTGTPDRPHRYVAFFNLDGNPVTLHATWKQLSIGGKHATRNLLDGIKVPPSIGIGLTLPGHGSAIYSVE
jgi:alpha-galactosidase